ncbi:MAG: hypothetical protein JW969_07890 [Spirochaetales bacterium]|nr:hypothetical protein [Spirochaetales bacterium]
MKKRKNFLVIVSFLFLTLLFFAGCNITSPQMETSAPPPAGPVSESVIQSDDEVTKSDSLTLYSYLDDVPDNTVVSGKVFGHFAVEPGLIYGVMCNWIYIAGAYVELAITGDSDPLIAADLNGGKNSALITAFSKTVYYYDHLDTAYLHLPITGSFDKIMNGVSTVNNNIDKYNKQIIAGSTADISYSYDGTISWTKINTGSYRNKRITSNDPFYPTQYREDYGFKKQKITKIWLTSEQITLLLNNQGKFGYCLRAGYERAMNDSYTSAPSWLKNLWSHPTLFTDCKLQYANIGLYIGTR